MPLLTVRRPTAGQYEYPDYLPSSSSPVIQKKALPDNGTFK